MQGEGKFNSYLSDVLASCFKSLVFLTLCFSGSSLAIEVDDDSNFLIVDILPLCTEEGQIVIELTNVSGQDLLVDPRYLDDELFDAHNLGLSAYYIDGDRIRTNRLQNSYTGKDLILFPVGESVRHKIDLRDYAKESIKFDEDVYPLFSALNVVIITTGEDRKVHVYAYTDDDYESDVIKPECWK